ncbi:hypothetical protein IID20_03965 [Patescibacteria group bacterium]|nr:hypothetical protein [Patescibacteria group bacterium]
MKKFLHQILTSPEVSIVLRKILEKDVKKYISDNDWQLGDTLWPMRFALSGSKASPSPFAIAGVLGKKETIARLTTAINSLEK